MAWMGAARIGLWNPSTRPSRRVIHPIRPKPTVSTAHTSTSLRLATTKSGTTFGKAASKPLRDTHITSPSPYIPLVVIDHSSGSIKIWHANTVPLGGHIQLRAAERVYCFVLYRETNEAEVEFDNGVVVVLTLGRDEPSYSMDPSGKLVYTRGSEVLASTLQIAAEDATPKARIFRYHRANLGQYSYPPMPPYVSLIGCSSLSLKCILLSCGETKYAPTMVC